MESKNVIFKHSLKEYNKKFRHHKNLLKFTKKEIEEFDRQANTIGEHYVLRKNKWWLIGDTYYQVPKVLGAYWFRNLNAGVQATTCLLGMGALGTAIALPTVLLNKKPAVINKVTISFNTRGGSSIDPITIDKGSKLTNIPTPTRENSEIDHWNIGNTGKAFDINNNINENTTLTAVYNIKETTEGLEYTVISDTDEKREVKVHVGDEEELPDYVKIPETVEQTTEEGTHEFNVVGTDNRTDDEGNTQGSFENTGVKEVQFPETGNFTSIDDNAFKNDDELLVVKEPDSVTETGDNQYEGCDKLEEVELSKNRDKLNEGTINDCPNVSELVIPENVDTIESSSATGNENLEVKCENEEGHKQYEDDDGEQIESKQDIEDVVKGKKDTVTKKGDETVTAATGEQDSGNISYRVKEKKDKEGRVKKEATAKLDKKKQKRDKKEKAIIPNKVCKDGEEIPVTEVVSDGFGMTDRSNNISEIEAGSNVEKGLEDAGKKNHDLKGIKVDSNNKRYANGLSQNDDKTLYEKEETSGGKHGTVEKLLYLNKPNGVDDNTIYIYGSEIDKNALNNIGKTNNTIEKVKIVAALEKDNDAFLSENDDPEKLKDVKEIIVESNDDKCKYKNNKDGSGDKLLITKDGVLEKVPCGIQCADNNLTIPNTVNTIGPKALQNMQQLNKVTINSSVTKIAAGAFKPANNQQHAIQYIAFQNLTDEWYIDNNRSKTWKPTPNESNNAVALQTTYVKNELQRSTSSNNDDKHNS